MTVEICCCECGLEFSCNGCEQEENDECSCPRCCYTHPSGIARARAALTTTCWEGMEDYLKRYFDVQTDSKWKHFIMGEVAVQ